MKNYILLPKKIQTPIVTLENDKKTTINLVGTVHIGSSKDYDELFSIINNNEVILYEMIKKSQKQTIKDKVIFLNTICFEELYKILAEEINIAYTSGYYQIFGYTG